MHVERNGSCVLSRRGAVPPELQTKVPVTVVIGPRGSAGVTSVEDKSVNIKRRESVREIHSCAASGTDHGPAPP